MRFAARILCSAAILTLVLPLGGCEELTRDEGPGEALEPSVRAVAKAPPQDPNRLPLREDTNVYKDDQPESLVCFYATRH